VPPDASVLAAKAGATDAQADDDENDSDSDEDSDYCDYCASYGHSESTCPLLHPTTSVKEGASSGSAVLSSQDASLMEGLISDEIVRKSFLVSLSGDLLKQTESDKSAFAQAQTQRVTVLAILHRALQRSRWMTRWSREAPSPDETGTFAHSVKPQRGPADEQANSSSAKGFHSTSSSSLLLQMCVELLRSSMPSGPNVSLDSSICVRILSTLSLVLATPTPLSLRNNPETSEWASSVVAFLISVAQAGKAEKAGEVSDMQKRAVMLLLHLVLQMGSLLTALRTVKLLGFHPPSADGSAGTSNSFLSASEYASFFSRFESLRPSLGVNASLNRTSAYFLGEFSFRFPNDAGQALLGPAAAKKGAQKRATGRIFRGRGRGRRGRAHGRGRMINADDEAGSDDQKTAFDVSLACSGAFFFVHSSSYGLARIGSGLNSTRRGHVYVQNVELGRDDMGGALAYVAPWLYYRSARTGSTVLRLSPDTLQQVEEISLTKMAGLQVHTDSPLIACHRYLYVLALHTPAAVAASNAAPGASASLSLHADADSHGAVAAASPRKREPVFEVITLDPNNGFAVVRRAVLNNPTRKVEDSAGASQEVAASASTPALKRVKLSCSFCKRFNALGNWYTADGGSTWCSLCHERGYRGGEHVRLYIPDEDNEQGRASWFQPTISGQPPSARFGHTAALVRGKRIASKPDEEEEEEDGGGSAGEEDGASGDAKKEEADDSDEPVNNVWLFGGGSGRPLSYSGAANTVDMVFNDISVFDADANAWHSNVLTSGDKPAPRLGHSCTVVGNRLFILFGGKDDTGTECFSDVYVFDTETRSWSKPLVTGASPDARLYHAATLVGEELLIHGGRGSNKVYADLYSLNVNTFTWTQIKCTGLPAPSRHGHTLVQRDDPMAADPTAVSVFCLGGCGHENQSNSQLPQFKIELVPVAKSKDESSSVSSSSAPVASAYVAPAHSGLRFEVGRWSALPKVQVYHVMGCASYALLGSKLWIIGGANQGAFMDRITTFNFDTQSWDDVYPTGAGKKGSLQPSGFSAHCTVDSRVLVFHGADHSGALDSVLALETAADPSVPLTPACLKEGLFWTQGLQLCMSLPPMLSPNVALSSHSWITRVFDLRTGVFLYDAQCGAQLPGHCAAFDAHSNQIVAYDAKDHVLRRWANSDPSPAFYEQAGVEVPGNSNSSSSSSSSSSNALAPSSSSSSAPVSDLSLRLLVDLEQFALFTAPPAVSTAASFDARRWNYETTSRGCVAHEDTLSEPFSVECAPQTFVLLYELLQSSMRGVAERFDDKPARLFYARALESCLTLLSLQVQRLSSTLEFVLTDLSVEQAASANGPAGKTPLNEALLRTLTELQQLAHGWHATAAMEESGAAASAGSLLTQRFQRVVVSCYEIISVGLPLFLPTQSARIAWFADFLRSHLLSPTDSAAGALTLATQRESLRLVLDRLIVNRGVSHALLEPASEFEGALPLQVVSVYEPEWEDKQAGSGAIGLLPGDAGVDEYPVENLLDSATEEYVANSSKLVHVVLSHRLRGQPMQPTGIKVLVSNQPGNTADMRGMRRARNLYNALVFVLETDDFASAVTATAAFDDMTDARYRAWRADKLQRNEPWDLAREPIGYVQFDSEQDVKDREKLQAQVAELTQRATMNKLPSLSDGLDAAGESQGVDKGVSAATDGKAAQATKRKKKLCEVSFEPVLLRDPATGTVVLRRAAGQFVLLKLLRAQAEAAKAKPSASGASKATAASVAYDDDDGWLLRPTAGPAPAAAPKKEGTATKAPVVSSADEPCIMISQVVLFGVECEAAASGAAAAMATGVRRLLPPAGPAASIPASVLSDLPTSSSGSQVLRFLLSRSLEYTSTQLNGSSPLPASLSHASSSCLSLLSLFQADLVSRAAKVLQAQDATANALVATLPPPAFLLLEYTQHVMETSHTLLISAHARLADAKDEAQLQPVIDVLTQSLLRTLLPALSTSLLFFASNQLFCMRLLPLLVRLLQALDRLSLQDASSPRASPTLSVLGRLLMRSEELYLSSADVRLRAFVVRSFSATAGAYVCTICAQSDASESDAMAHMTEAHADASQRVSHASEVPTPWLLDLQRSLASLAGRASATLIRGLPVSKREREHSKWLDSCPIFGNGLETLDLVALLRQRRQAVQHVAEQSSNGLLVALDDLFEPLEALEGSAVHPNQLSETLFVRCFLDLPAGSIGGTLPAPAEGIKQLARLCIKLPMGPGGQPLPLNNVPWVPPQQTQQGRVKPLSSHPAILRALSYARIALLKHLGLLPEAALFAELLASQKAGSNAKPVDGGGFEVALVDLPPNLRPVWLYAHLLHMWLHSHVTDLPSQTSAPQSASDGEEKKDDSGASSSPAVSSLSAASVSEDPLIGVCRGVIERAICLLKVQSAFPAQSLREAHTPGAASDTLSLQLATSQLQAADSDALPPIPSQRPSLAAGPRAHSQWQQSPADPLKEQRERALGSSLAMWRSLLSVELSASSSSSSSSSGGPPALSLQRQGSMSNKSGAKDNLRKRPAPSGHSLLDYLVQFLRSDIDIDPTVAAERERTKKKKAASLAESAVVEDDAAGGAKKDEGLVALSPSHLMQFLLLRRHRALSRAEGFRFVHQLLSTSASTLPTPFLSVQSELLKHLAPSLRGAVEKEKSLDLKAGASAICDELAGEDDEDDSTGSKTKSDEDATKGRMESGFHFSTDTAGAGRKIAAALSQAFQQLFAKLVLQLHGQARAVLEKPLVVDGASKASSPRSASIPLLSSDALSLSILASLGMAFTHSDHAFLDSSGLIHTIRRLMELDATPAATASDALPSALALASAKQAVASRLKLKESSWFCFRLLALSGFGGSSMAVAGESSNNGTQLTKFQTSLLELTSSVIEQASHAFLDSKRKQKQAQQEAEAAQDGADSDASTASVNSRRSSRSSSSGSARRARGGRRHDDEDGNEAGDESDDETRDAAEDDEEAKSNADDEVKSDADDEEDGGSDDGQDDEDDDAAAADSAAEDDSAAATTVAAGDDGDASASALSLAVATAPGETCFGMLRLVLSMCGGQGNHGNKKDEKKEGADAAGKDKKNASVPEDDSVLRYLSASSSFLNLLATLLAHGTPRIQRLSLRLMRRLLPQTQNPDTLHLAGLEHDGDSAGGRPTGGNVVSCLMNMIGHLLCAQSEDAGDSSATIGRTKSSGGALKQRYYRSAQVSLALASELIALMRILFATPAWTNSIKAALIAAIEPVPQLLKRVSSVSEHTPGLKLALAAWAVLGGQREVLRVGGKVEVFHTKARRKRKVATLLAYDPLAATASVVYDSVAMKSVQVLARGMCIVATEEVAFDAAGLNLLDESTRPILTAMRAALDEILQPTVAETGANVDALAALDPDGPSLRLAPPSSAFSLDPDNSMSGSLSLTPDATLGSAPSLSAMPRREHSASVPAPVAAVPLVLVQLRSRAMRALWNLLGSRSNVHACVRAGFGPVLTRVSQLQTSIPIGDPASGRLEEVERLTDRFAELCQEQGLLFKQPSLTAAGAAFAEQAAALPFNPYRSFVKLPSRMTSTDPLLVIEDASECSCQLVSTGRTQAWEDEVPAWAECPFPPELPSIYFEVTIMNRSMDGSIGVGLYPAGKKIQGFPGQRRVPGSIGIFDNGYYSIDRISQDIQWPAGCSESAKFWADGDVIGVLHNRMTGFVSFVHNGVMKEDVMRLPANKQWVAGTCVSAAGTRLLVNFGQRPFRFPFAESKFVPASLGGSMSADVHDEADEEEDADDKTTASVSSSSISSARARRARGVDSERDADKDSASASAADETDPMAAKKKAMMEAEAAEKKKAEQAAAAANKPEEEEKKSDETAASADSAAAGASAASAAEGKEEEKDESKEEDASARRRDARAGASDAAAATAGSNDRDFDAWNDEDDFDGDDEEGDDDEAEDQQGDASTDEEAADENDGNDYDEYGRTQSRRKARLPPLTIDAIEIGMLVAIKAKKALSDAEKKAAKKAARRARRGANGKDAAKKVPASEKLVGRVLQVSRPKRSVLLSCYQSESGLAHISWFSISSIARLKPRVNGDLCAAVEAEKQLLQTALEHEACLASCYARNALLEIIAHSLQRNNKASDKQQLLSLSSSMSALSLEEQDVDLSLDDVGGAEAICAAAKRAALDQARDTSAKVVAIGEDAAGGDEATSTCPVAVFRRFLLSVLRSGGDEHLALLLRREAISGLSSGSNSSLGWMERIKSKDLVNWGMQLIDLLLSVQQRVKPSAGEVFTKAVPAGPQSASASSTFGSRAHVPLPVYSIEVYDALVKLLLPSKKLKVFKPTAVDTTVYLLLARLISQVDRFEDGVPDLSKLDWLAERMTARHALEVKHLGKDVAVSRPLQTIINLVLAKEQAKSTVASASASSSASSVSASSLSLTPPSAAAFAGGASDDDDDPTNIGPDESLLSWFDMARQTSQLMASIESGAGVPAWFIRLAWLDMQLQKLARVCEGEHPYTRDSKWSEIVIPDAQSLTIRLDARSKSDASDKLRFAVLAAETSGPTAGTPVTASGSALSIPSSSGPVLENALVEVASFSGSDMAKSGTGSLVKGGQSVELKGMSRVFWSFTQSPSPVHPNVFCSACDFPIKGVRLVCTHCDGSDESSHHRRRRRHDDRSEGYSLCAACEAANQDTAQHDRSHVFAVVRRPLPRAMSLPRVAPPVSHLYNPSQLAAIKAGQVHHSEQQKHVGVSCGVCGVSPIVGVRYRCAVCPQFDCCSVCLSDSNALEHDRSHPLFKLRHPVLSVSGLTGVLQSFAESVREGEPHWGYRFTCTASFAPVYVGKLLMQHKDEVAAAIHALRKYRALGPAVPLAMDAQCVEIINRHVNKLVSSGEKKARGSGGGRGRNRRNEEDSAATTDADYLAMALEPRAIVSTPKDLSVYHALQNCSVSDVWMRMAVLKSLNTRLGAVLPLIDWSLVQHEWSLSYVFGRLRGLVFSQLKLQLWRAALSANTSVSTRRAKKVVLDNVLAAQAREMAAEWDPLDVLDATLFGQLFAQAGKWAAEALRGSGQAWQTSFKGESGYDAGGLFRDALSKVCVDLQSEHVPLFIPCPNKRAGVGITLDKFIPSPRCTSSNFLAMFEFVGRLMGVAIRTNNTLELDLPSIVWKPLVGQDLEVGDLTAIDQMATSAMALLLDDKALKDKGIDEDNFEDVYGLDFTYPSADGTLVELVENGTEKPVTWSNRSEYVRLVLDFRLHELALPVRALRAGITSVIPARFLSLLTWKELETETCGQAEIDIDVLKANTVYGGCGPHDPHIRHFWAVLTSFSQLERAQFLRFTWGRSRLPAGAKFRDKLRIDSTNLDITHLPAAHTCFFSLELPRYTTEDMMRDKLTKAITLCTSMELM